MTSNDILDEAADLAGEIVDEARCGLMLALRFMDVALWRMPIHTRSMKCTVGTDGYRFYVDSLGLIQEYRDDPNEVVRDYLHTILHCVFRHNFDGKHANLSVWDVACDICVEACALELAGMRYPSSRDAERQDALKKLRLLTPQFTANKIYKVLLDARDKSPEARKAGLAGKLLESLPGLFVRDDHGIWTRVEEQPQSGVRYDSRGELLDAEHTQRMSGGEDTEQEDDDAKADPSVNQDGSPTKSSGGLAVEGEIGNGDRFLVTDSGQDAVGELASMEGVIPGDFDDITWKDISKLLEIEMEAFTGNFGVQSGTFEVNLSVANRKVYDYRDFLKRFSSRSEEMKVSTEEFDYIYYTYGLRKYGNMPLIEPLEYQESNRVREFVIAIDTSASCAGGLIKQFIEKTYDVLKSTNGFGRKMNVHVIQCDCDIRRDTKITETSDIDDTFFEFVSQGYGGTDFRPVFAYVDELIAMRELTNLKGLIYLTDGIGKYPEKPPEYDTAFVFVDETQTDRPIPPWAMKVFMSEDEIIEL